MHTLTRDRLARLCADIRNTRARALTSPHGDGTEHSYLGQATMALGLEDALFRLIADLAGTAAARTLQQAFDNPISAEELAAYTADQAARRARFAQQAAPQTTTASA